MSCMQLPLITMFLRPLYYFPSSVKPYMMLQSQIAQQKLCKSERTEWKSSGAGGFIPVAASWPLTPIEQEQEISDSERVRDFLMMNLESWWPPTLLLSVNHSAFPYSTLTRLLGGVVGLTCQAKWLGMSLMLVRVGHYSRASTGLSPA